jgi:hypothetical protein
MITCARCGRWRRIGTAFYERGIPTRELCRECARIEKQQTEGRSAAPREVQPFTIEELVQACALAAARRVVRKHKPTRGRPARREYSILVGLADVLSRSRQLSKTAARRRVARLVCCVWHDLTVYSTDPNAVPAFSERVLRAAGIRIFGKMIRRLTTLKPRALQHLWGRRVSTTPTEREFRERVDLIAERLRVAARRNS